MVVLAVLAAASAAVSGYEQHYAAAKRCSFVAHFIAQASVPQQPVAKDNRAIGKKVMAKYAPVIGWEAYKLGFTHQQMLTDVNDGSTQFVSETFAKLKDIRVDGQIAIYNDLLLEMNECDKLPLVQLEAASP